MESISLLAWTEALAPFAWPALVLVVLVLFYRPFKQAIASRRLTVKAGGFEISVQEVSEQIGLQLEDLRQKVAGLEAHPTARIPVAPPDVRAPVRPTVLWVDDNPQNNALLIDRLQKAGVTIHLARSTPEGMHQSAAHRPTFIITDMGRTEGGTYRAAAGLELIQQLRSGGMTTPVVVFTTADGAATWHDKVREAGGLGTTTSAIELFMLLRDAGVLRE